MPAIPSWLLEPLWDQFAALLPGRPLYHPAHPLGCHKPRIADRLIFEKLLQVLRFGCSYAAIADCTCGATASDRYEDALLRTGFPTGTPQEALDTACTIHLADLDP